MAITIFVYGTLMKGLGNERVIDGFPHSNERVKVSGYDMYNVGGFPALVEGTHDYYGELITFDESVNPASLYYSMDRLEGYNKNSPATSMYLRKPIECIKENGERFRRKFIFGTIQPMD